MQSPLQKRTSAFLSAPNNTAQLCYPPCDIHCHISHHPTFLCKGDQDINCDRNIRAKNADKMLVSELEYKLSPGNNRLSN